MHHHHKGDVDCTGRTIRYMIFQKYSHHSNTRFQNFTLHHLIQRLYRYFVTDKQLEMHA